MAEPFIGEICCFGFNFAPRDWAKCNGQLMPIAQNDALFAIIGTIYGGDGQTTFALPNLQGRIPMHWGNSPGLNTVIGESQGQSTVTLTTSQIPLHNHIPIAATADVSQRSPDPGNTSFISSSQIPNRAYDSTPSAITQQFSPKAISVTGGSQAHDNMQPYLVLNFCIALFGVFPTRN